MDALKDFFSNDFFRALQRILNAGPEIPIGEDRSIHLTLGLILTLVFVYAATGFLLKWLRRLITRNMKEEDKLKFISVFKFINYTVYLTVILITLSAAGINVTVLLTASAALLVGLGLALQVLFQDIIAGIMIIVDKSVLVGDVVEVEGKVGRIFEIKLRTTRALTRDDRVIVIPNHKFISDTVYNFTQNNRTTRESVQVGVSYSSQPEQVRQVLLDAAASHGEVLKYPQPFVTFDDFGDSALIFNLHFFVNDSFRTPFIESNLRFEIFRRFRESGIVIPFPQRDLHVYRWPEQPLSTQTDGRENPS